MRTHRLLSLATVLFLLTPQATQSQQREMPWVHEIFWQREYKLPQGSTLKVVNQDGWIKAIRYYDTNKLTWAVILRHGSPHDTVRVVQDQQWLTLYSQQGELLLHDQLKENSGPNSWLRVHHDPMPLDSTILFRADDFGLEYSFPAGQTDAGYFLSDWVANGWMYASVGPTSKTCFAEVFRIMPEELYEGNPNHAAGSFGVELSRDGYTLYDEGNFAFVRYMKRGWAEIQKAARKAVRGEKAPPFSVTRWFNTPPLSVDSLSGKVFAVYFWSYYCGPCQRHLKELERLQQALPNSQFQVVTIHQKEAEAKVEKFIRMKKLKVPVGLDDGMTNIAYASRFANSLFLVDKHGKIRLTRSSTVPSAEDIQALINEQ